jgi:hypothetical protein
VAGTFSPKPDPMRIKVVMPLHVYHAFLGRCVLPSREYAILRNSLIDHIADARPTDWVQILCAGADAKVILDHARRVYPEAAAYVERSIGSYSIQAHEPALEYRQYTNGDTWHFATSCSQWPLDNFITCSDPPRGHELCNECIVKSQPTGRDR